MTQLQLDGIVYGVEPEETVLDALLRQGVAIPHGCKAGACQSCMIRSEDGAIPAAAQVGLKSEHKDKHYFLSCSCKPQGDMTLSLTEQVLAKTQARVLDVARLGEHVLRIRLESAFDFKAGQYLNIWLDDSTVRSYSIASSQSLDHSIELHVKLLANGRFSQWADTNLRAGVDLTVQGPLGDCVYRQSDPQQPLLLVGIGTGLAPLYGIIKEAVAQQHQGPIHLVLGARSADGFYLQAELADLQRDSLVQVDFVCLDDAKEGDHVGDLYQYVKKRFSSTTGYRVYLCGAGSFVRKMKRQCFLSGANMSDIHADAFLPCS